MKVDEHELDRVEAIILSMTPEERRRPELIKGSRRLRIAKGSGTNVQQVNQLVKQFDQMRKMMRGIGQGKMPDLGALMRAGAERAAGTLALARRGPLGPPAGRGTLAPATLSRRLFQALREELPLAVRLRLTRVGGKKDPIWRVVVADQPLPARRPRHRDDRPLQRADRPLDDRSTRSACATGSARARSRPTRSASC